MCTHIQRNVIKIGAASCLMLLAGACSKPEQQEAKPVVPVQTTAVQRSSIQRIVRAHAILYPLNQAGVAPKISAPVRVFYVNRGDHVRKGQLLAELENRDLTAAALEAKGNLDQAEANFRSITAASLPEELMKAKTEVNADKEALDAAQKVFESRKTLFDQGAIPRKQLDEGNVAYVQARSQYEIALHHLESLQKVGREEQVKAAQAQVEAARGRFLAAEAQVEYSKILSPIDGVITDRPLYPGEMVSPGTPMLTVMDVNKVIARANVPAGQLLFLKAGNSATITSIDSSVELSGRVTVVSSAMDPNSTTAEVWVLAPNPGERLKPGSSVEVALLAETVQDALIIPKSALLPSQEGVGDKVLVAGSDSLAHEREIEAGIREGDKVQVLKGLSLGEQVITLGGFGIEDKTKVKIENAATLKGDEHEQSKPEK